MKIKIEEKFYCAAPQRPECVTQKQSLKSIPPNPQSQKGDQWLVVSLGLGGMKEFGSDF